MNGYFPDWDEWRGLTNEQRDYELYRVLSFLHADSKQARLDSETMRESCRMQVAECEKRFQNIQDEVRSKRWLDRTVATVSAAIGGALAYIGIRIGG